MNQRFLSWHDINDIKFIARTIAQGKVFVGTSDTVLGLLAEASPIGVQSLNNIKGRSHKPYIILIQSTHFMSNFSDCNMNQACNLLIKNCWPGPLTIIVRAQSQVPRDLVSVEGTVALRVPDHKGLQKLLELVPALFSTSANAAGSPVPAKVDEIESPILNSVAGIITDDHQNNAVHISQPSTIIDCTGSQVHLIREGAYPVQVLESICGQKIIRS